MPTYKKDRVISIELQRFYEDKIRQLATLKEQYAHQQMVIEVLLSNKYEKQMLLLQESQRRFAHSSKKHFINTVRL